MHVYVYAEGQLAGQRQPEFGTHFSNPNLKKCAST